MPYADYSLEGSVALPNLTEGWHNLTLNEGSVTVKFYVEPSSDQDNSTPSPQAPTNGPLTQRPTVNPAKEAFQRQLSAAQLNFTIGVLSFGIILLLAILTVYFKRAKRKRIRGRNDRI